MSNLYCTAEANIILHVNYNLKNKKFLKILKNKRKLKIINIMNERGISLQIIQSLEGLYRDVMFNFMTISLNNTLNGLSP